MYFDFRASRAVSESGIDLPLFSQWLEWLYCFLERFLDLRAEDVSGGGLVEVVMFGVG